jgi:hypothetical protein
VEAGTGPGSVRPLGLGCLAALLAADADADASTVPMVIFFGTVLVSLIGGFAISRPVVARRIDDEFIPSSPCATRGSA